MYISFACILISTHLQSIQSQLASMGHPNVRPKTTLVGEGSGCITTSANKLGVSSCTITYPL